MDGNSSNPLVLLPSALETTPRQIIVGGAPFEDETEADFGGLLQQTIAWLCQFVSYLLSLIQSLQLQIIDLRCQANYWRAQHQRSREREDDLKVELQLARAKHRELERRLFGRKSETASSTQPTSPTRPPSSRRRRGQQLGSKGHGRRPHEHLPTIDEPCILPDDQKRCPCCGEPFEEIPGTADGELLEIEVRAYRRRYHRQRYRRRCTCPGQPAIVTAPPPDKLIPKSIIGISTWVLILRRKFEFFLPLYRVLAELRSHELQLPSGTITDGLQKFVPLLQPLYEALVQYNRQEGHWHCDETRWLVFVKQSDKANFIWNLWVFAAKESIVFVLDPTRAHDVPEKHFGDDAQGVINVDRYSAYKAMAQVKAGQLVLAFCWAHVRRDFLAVLTGWPELTDWAWSWVDEIAELYQRNDKRLSLPDKPAEYAQADQLVREHVEHMRQRCEQELAQPQLRLAQEKALTSMQTHWAGLTVFVDQPHVPLDNNKAERCHRGPVVGRKNFYGSGSLWSGRLAAMCFSLFQTIQAWKLDVGRWLTTYLSACAAAKGKPPPDPHLYLPWNMTPDQRQRLRVTDQQISTTGSASANPKPPPSPVQIDPST